MAYFFGYFMFHHLRSQFYYQEPVKNIFLTKSNFILKDVPDLAIKAVHYHTTLYIPHFVQGLMHINSNLSFFIPHLVSQYVNLVTHIRALGIMLGPFPKSALLIPISYLIVSFADRL